MAAEAGIPVLEGNFTPYDVYNADEAFTASTSRSITPVKSLNGIDIGTGVPGPMTLYFIKQWIAMVGTGACAPRQQGQADRTRGSGADPRSRLLRASAAADRRTVRTSSRRAAR
jgi:hypothetical protein